MTDKIEVEPASDEEIAFIRRSINEDYVISRREELSLLARLDHERKRADNAEYDLQVSNGVVGDLAKSLRTDPAQRRREIWEAVIEIWCSDKDAGPDDAIVWATNLHAAFTAAMDAEKGDTGGPR